MVIGSGIDIVEVGRVQAIMDRWQDSFFKKIFTDKELAYAHSKKYTAEHLAARIDSPPAARASLHAGLLSFCLPREDEA